MRRYLHTILNICGTRNGFLRDMDWINNLVFGTGIAHSIAVFSAVIALGVALGKVKICGISLGITWVLFAGLALSHFGITVEDGVLHFMKEFGLVLFVYSIGLQVGPGFFSSFKKDGFKMNMIAVGGVLFSSAVAVMLGYATNTSISTMSGVLSGAVTNTPGLGAAQQTYADIHNAADTTISLGYAVAYPFGVLGVIGTIILMKYAFRINPEKEMAKISGSGAAKNVVRVSALLTNQDLIGKKMCKAAELLNSDFVISRICRANGEFDGVTPDTVFAEGDKLRVICDENLADNICAKLGEKINMEWNKSFSKLEARRIMVSNVEVAGKDLQKLGLAGGYSFNITRVNRAGIDLVAHPDLKLQLGDRATVVGMPEAVSGVEKTLGNSMLKLRKPNLLPLFVGLILGMLLGTLPILIPGVPQPIKLGLAGGPLIVAILMGRYGYQMKFPTYMTMSANFMIREIGISLFLAGVGLGAGGSFVDTMTHGAGFEWMCLGAVITLSSAFFMCIFGRLFKCDYYTILGMLSGSMTNPTALAYSNSISPCDRPNIAYSTVYPLSMFMRVLCAQMIIIFLV